MYCTYIYIYIICLEEGGAGGKLEGCLRGSSTTSFRENIESRDTILVWRFHGEIDRISGFFFNWNAYVLNGKKNSFFRGQSYR